MTLPWHDWQFWAVTLLALGALVFIARNLLPSNRRRSQRRATLTLERKMINRK